MANVINNIFVRGPTGAIGDHLGSTSLTTDSNGTKVSEMRYTAWGEVRSSWKSGQSTTPAYILPNYTFTGQFSYMDDPTTTGTTEGFGLLFYNARMYDPVLGRFTQADSIVPSGVQGLDRYAYVNNSPINYTDPSGHVGCDEVNDKGKCADLKSIIKQEIQSKYKVKLTGSWDENELGLFGESLDKTAKYLGGVDELNELIILAAHNWDKDASTITIRNVSGATYTPGNLARAAWCGDNGEGNCSTNTIVYADGMFDSSYQNTGTSFPRPANFSDAERIQVSMVHELIHVLTDARPSAVSIYGYRGLGSEEDMANTVAVHTVSQEADWPGHEAQTQFSIDAVSFFTLPYGILP